MKPGLKTTEFWVVILTFLVAMVSGLTVENGTVNFALNQEVVQWWILGSGGGYAVSRGLAKSKGEG